MPTTWSVIFSEKQQIIKKSGLLEYYEASEDFSQVAGLDNLKQWLAKRSIAFTDRAARFGLSPPRGVMLLGVQGCGKSLFCQGRSQPVAPALAEVRRGAGNPAAWSVPARRNAAGAIQTADELARRPPG